MPNNINFFTPVRYLGQKTVPESALEKVDDFFYLGGRSVFVISGGGSSDREGGILQSNQDPGGFKQLFFSALKITCYVTVIIPLVMLVAKAILRSSHKFHILDDGLSIHDRYFSCVKDISFWSCYIEPGLNLPSVAFFSFSTICWRERPGFFKKNTPSGAVNC